MKLARFDAFKNKKTSFRVFVEFFSNLFFTYCVIIGFALIIFSSVTLECVVTGSSMKPTYNNYMSNNVHDVVFVNTKDKNVTYGDIVVCKTQTESIIKRVVGLPHDVIDIVWDENEYKLELNGKIIEEKYIYVIVDPRVPTRNRNGMNYTFERFDALRSSKPELFNEDAKLVVPDNQIFVLGDNRGVSIDSSSLGTIDYSNLEGQVELVKYHGTSDFSFYYDYIIEGKFIATIINIFN